MDDNLYAHFCEPEHKGLDEMQIELIHMTDRSNPTEREGFWAYNLDSCIPRGLNIKRFYAILKEHLVINKPCHQLVN